MKALRTESVSKELRVMESSRPCSTIDWKHFFYYSHSAYSAGKNVPPNPSMTSKIRRALTQYRRSIENKVLWPYSTRKGISEESTRIYLGLTQNLGKPWMDIDTPTQPVSSRDVVSFFLHYGVWIHGNCELKQRWYPSILTPRTYFAQGGDAIRVSSYLRDFFNDLCDCFLPTDRYARVDGSRLVTYDDGYFFIYDLTSFSSNFHEQLPFLHTLAEFFSETYVYLVSAKLELIRADLGEMIMEYANTINDEPLYWFSRKVFDEDTRPPVPSIHKVAGFLGVPGNLATCTLPHGMLVSQHLDDESKQSCAGDDGCIGCQHDKHQQEIEHTIQLLGIFQPDKGSSTRFQEAASYLKRRFVQEGKHAWMFHRVEYLMLSLVHSFRNTDPRFPELCMDKSKLRSSIAKSVVSLIRSLYIFTNGVYLEGEMEYVLDFLSYVYGYLDLPRGGQLRGMLFDDCDSVRKVRESLVFPLNSEYLKQDPDVLISERFLPWVVAFPEVTSIECSDFSGDWLPGEERVFRMSSIVEKLVKYGWLSRQQTPKRYLVGEDARRFFRRLMKDEIRDLEYKYTCLVTLSSDILSNLGVYQQLSSKHLQTLSRYGNHYKTYRDLDEPEDNVTYHVTLRSSSGYTENQYTSQSFEMGTLEY